MLIPFLGRSGQKALLDSTVLVIGAGGIGSSLLMYLAASGVSLTIVDHDTVDISNLHRQVIHDTASAGLNKAISATQRLSALNPSGSYLAITDKLSCANALELVSCHSLVVDCTDNIDARYIINDACVLANKPWVTASAIGMEAQVHVIVPYKTACYRCLHADISVAESCRSCSNVGILGPVAGMVGCLQAIEVIKLLAANSVQSALISSSSMPSSLMDKQVYYDGYASDYMSLTLPPRHPQCTVCGDLPSMHTLADTEAFLNDTRAHVQQCVSEHIGSLAEGYEVSPQTYHQLYHADSKVHVILDVRPAVQFDLLRLQLPGLVLMPSLTQDSIASSARYMVNIPFAQFQALRTLPSSAVLATAPVVCALQQLLASIQQACQQEAVVYVLCRRGVDSKIITRVLRDQVQLPYQVFNLTGGCVAWSEQVDEGFPVY